MSPSAKVPLPPLEGGAYLREVELGPPVRSWLAKFCSEVAEELDSGSGIADFVGGSLPRDRPTAKLGAIPVVDSLQLSVLERCSAGASEQELRAWAPWGWRGLRLRAVEPLLEVGLMTESEGLFRTVEVPRNPFSELVAVELKLRAWSRGVAQAGAYRMFAHRSWVAVPADRITPSLLDQARHNDVGVIGVDPEGHVKEVVPAIAHEPLRPRSTALVAQRMIAARGMAVVRRAGSTIC